ncbi:MAG: NAD(P)-dependent oxidoreductase [Dehalococcoidia bacterium]
MTQQAQHAQDGDRAGRPVVGFIGLGIMGLPMTANLLKAGYRVIGWNRSPARLDEAVQGGAERGASPADVAARSDVTIVCVTATVDVEAVVLGVPGTPGAIEGARPGTVLVDMSSISPQVTREIAARLRARGVEMLDAPVSGGQVGAVNGTLSIMVGGDAAALERVRPVLEAMGQRITHCGPSGAGQTVKVCNQIVVSVNALAMSEGLLFCQQSGVDPRTMIEAISGGAAGSWQLSNLGPRIVSRDFAPGFKVSLQQKDLRIALESAEALGVPLAGVSLVHQLYSVVEQREGGDLGTQALVRALELLAGVEVGVPPAG